ncbi:MAG: PfkB family carbohydrate kinase [Puniceicoccales bacterium]|jgi:D-beta-D-heptose 7-phosphate kinase/D-beta-D-heptose 1-phosphate adenosyltransferase|nr:PfkB family carbohydrate kinase [Puniceicoccales bacterium]
MLEIKELVAKLKGCRILVVGDVMLDHYIHGDATRISPEAPVPVVHVSHERSVVGGAANVALNICSLGGRATVCGMLGRDGPGDRLGSLLKKAGVRFPSAFRRAKTTTIIKSRVVVRNQQLCRLDYEEDIFQYALDSDSAKKALLAELFKVDAVIISDYAKGTVSGSLISLIQAAAKKRGIIVALDPKPRRKIPFDGVDLITPNKSEAMELAGIAPEEYGHHFPAEEVCRRIWEKHHPKNLVITLGPDGMLISHKGELKKIIPTYAREVFDVSGAGDTVIATLTLALSAGIEIEDAAHLANTAAGVVVGKFGTATATPSEVIAYHR